MFNSGLKNNEIALAAYQKKPTYGPGRIFIKNGNFLNNKKNKIIELKSIIKIDGEVYNGKEKVSLDINKK